ncbi:diguanylate cyclase [Herbaspirillum rhizosphaerae]|uniref:GGDEF domain-containing protein n=1 Tax=Herbaspirillum rhizosphaerae TaxID=346179 RepID=UPI00142F3AAA|nr:GGDEF domain-containing protein [Herbaspirillum rhizosphaerae]
MQDELYLIKEAEVGSRQIGLAKVVVTLLLLSAAIATPLAMVPLLPIPGYMSAFGIAMIIINIILGALLFAKGLIESKERTIRLGTAYFFVTIVFIPLIAAFPGGLMAEPILGTSSSAVWLWCYWHIGFGLLIIRYALSADDVAGTAASVRNSIIAVVAVVALLTLSATVGLPYMPAVFRNGKNFFDDSTFIIPALVFGINLIGLLCVMRMRDSRPEQLWVMVGMFAACIDVWLTLYGGSRFSLGWYFAKMTSLFTSLVVLISQLYGITRLYNSIAGANKILMTQANQDGLTALSNRRCFDQVLEIEWNRARRDKRSLALLMIDVDFFKKYNDCYGHLAGDDCLRQIANHLLAVINRPGDVAARYGGEEFVVMLPNTDAGGARLVAERLLYNLSQAAIPHAQNLPSGYVTLSIGVSAMVPGAGSTTTMLALAADKALYEAKDHGRNQIRTGVLESIAPPISPAYLVG